MEKQVKFTLQNVWEKRKEFLRAAAAAGAWCGQYKAAVNAKSRKELITLIFKNISWVYDRELIDLGRVGSIGAVYPINNELYLNVYLYGPYLGTDDWFMDADGYLVMPYYDKNNNSNWRLPDPPLYKYVEELQAMLDAGQELPKVPEQPE